MWEKIIGMSRRSGHPVLFLCPLLPAELAAQAHWAVLDCEDDVRVARLRARQWTESAIDDACADAAEYRSSVGRMFRTDQDEPQAVAELIMTWTTSTIAT